MLGDCVRERKGNCKTLRATSGVRTKACGGGKVADRSWSRTATRVPSVLRMRLASKTIGRRVKSPPTTLQEG